MVLIVGCSNEYAGTSDEKNTKDTSEETKQTDNQKDEQEAKLEIVDQASGAWTDSIGSVWVHTGAIYKNTGDVPVEIGETQMNYKAQDGSVLGTSTMVYSVPSVVGPNETAFIGETTILDGETDSANFKETTFNFGFDKTKEDPTLLETSVVKGIKGDDYSSYRVTGMVKNTTDAKQDDIRLAAALLDESGKLVGVLVGLVDIGVNPGSEAGFELAYPEIPKEAEARVAKIEVKAYGFNF